ncbi:hypothetical protein LEP1GSC125_3788 [Leptospira mayottensis 200901122]|uniref:Uncharacterized protein n=1 Tax=Leptospira mayottensis 200901122 TaxID=1193010 RepID=A0AA87SZQ2_9LEPT|nr:hypothetical protein LEP1GSC125_3788 [Leptospira mayottensis 200901122]
MYPKDHGYVPIASTKEALLRLNEKIFLNCLNPKIRFVL